MAIEVSPSVQHAYHLNIVSYPTKDDGMRAGVGAVIPRFDVLDRAAGVVTGGAAFDRAA